MARYPTFEEYQTRGNYTDGIKRCDELLQRTPKDVQLQTVKLKLLYAANLDPEPAFQQLLSIQPPIRDLRELVSIEEAVVSSQEDVFPQPQTAGPLVSKLWDNACKAFTQTDHKVDLLSIRFSRAVVDSRLVDAQQALIQYKALQPKNRVVYMAHAAVTQLLSTSKEDLQSRLALSLARKAVSENFDDDKILDCRVPGQIFAWQGSAQDLEAIENRSFKESRQVYDALRRSKVAETNGVEKTQLNSQIDDVALADGSQNEAETLKIQFSTLVESSAPLQQVLTLAARSMRLFHGATKQPPDRSRRAVVEACFISISSWIRAFDLTGELRYLLMASLLAETLLEHNQHVHEARLILVYLYMRLGLGSLAVRLFDSLSVKEIQHDTVGHALFTRLSSMHPHDTKVSKNEVLDPLKRMARALAIYGRHEEKMAECEAAVLNHGQTGMIFDVRELRNSLRSSLTRRIILLEQRRIARLLHGQSQPDSIHVNDLRPRVVANWLETMDNRDFSGTFNYGYNVEKILHGRSARLPGRNWLLYSLAADSAWCLATEQLIAVIDVEKLLLELSNGMNDSGLTEPMADGLSASELSETEALASNVAYHLLRLLVNLTQRPAEVAADVESARKAVERLNVAALLDQKDAFTERLPDHYTCLDILGIVVKACAFASKRTTDSGEALLKLQHFAQSYYNSIVNHAKKQIDGVTADNIKEYMLQDDYIREAMKPLSEGDVHTFCKSIASSASEGWNGLTKLRIV